MFATMYPMRVSSKIGFSMVTLLFSPARSLAMFLTRSTFATIVQLFAKNSLERSQVVYGEVSGEVCVFRGRTILCYNRDCFAAFVILLKQSGILVGIVFDTNEMIVCYIGALWKKKID
jgi:hypothetical protein